MRSRRVRNSETAASRGFIGLQPSTGKLSPNRRRFTDVDYAICTRFSLHPTVVSLDLEKPTPAPIRVKDKIDLLPKNVMHA